MGRKQWVQEDLVWCNPYKGLNIDGQTITPLPENYNGESIPSESRKKTLVQLKCNSYRGKSSGNFAAELTTWNKPDPGSLAPKQIIDADRVHKLWDIIQAEKNRRRQHQKYQNITDDTSTTTTDKGPRGDNLAVRKLVLADNINKMSQWLKTYANDTYLSGDMEFKNRNVGDIVRANNDIRTDTVNLINDCICYSDCNNYYYQGQVSKCPAHCPQY